MGYRETAERFHIQHGRVQDWERIYLTEGPEGFSVERRGRGSKGRPKQLPKEVEEDLLAEVQRLRAENEYLKNLQALVLERERRQGKSPGSPKTEAKIRSGYSSFNRSTASFYVLLSSQENESGGANTDGKRQKSRLSFMKTRGDTDTGALRSPFAVGVSVSTTKLSSDL